MKKKGVVWVVIHCEYFLRDLDPNSSPIIDEMVFHIASSLPAVEKYMRASGVIPHSWWKVEQHVVDQNDHYADDRPQALLFNYRGLPATNARDAATLRAFKKYQRDEIAEAKRVDKQSPRSRDKL